MHRSTIFVLLSLACVSALAQERRAPRPTFSQERMRGIFFEKLSDAFRGPRPTLQSVRKSAAPVTAPTQSTSSASEQADRWSSLISPTSLEDEVKRVRLHFDSVVTTPSAFNSGGFQAARVDLTVLATLFGVINEHAGEVRWKNQAAAARDLLARTAFNCKAGSTQVYNEAKLRKADLQDLVSGSGLADRSAEKTKDWSTIADRSPLMEYAESLIEATEELSNSEASAERESETISRNAELLAMFGAVLISNGMDDFDDEDYANFSRGLSKSSQQVAAAIERHDFAAVSVGVAKLRQRCDACHEAYR